MSLIVIASHTMNGKPTMKWNSRPLNRLAENSFRHKHLQLGLTLHLDSTSELLPANQPDPDLLVSWIDNLKDRVDDTLEQQQHELLQLRIATENEVRKEEYRHKVFLEPFDKLGEFLARSETEKLEGRDGPHAQREKEEISDEDEALEAVNYADEKEDVDEEDDDVVEILSSEPSGDEESDQQEEDEYGEEELEAELDHQIDDQLRYMDDGVEAGSDEDLRHEMAHYAEAARQNSIQEDSEKEDSEEEIDQPKEFEDQDNIELYASAATTALASGLYNQGHSHTAAPSFLIRDGRPRLTDFHVAYHDENEISEDQESYDESGEEHQRQFDDEEKQDEEQEEEQEEEHYEEEDHDDYESRIQPEDLQHQAGPENDEDDDAIIVLSSEEEAGQSNLVVHHEEESEEDSEEKEQSARETAMHHKLYPSSHVQNISEHYSEMEGSDDAEPVSEQESEADVSFESASAKSADEINALICEQENSSNDATFDEANFFASANDSLEHNELFANIALEALVGQPQDVRSVPRHPVDRMLSDYLADVESDDGAIRSFSQPQAHVNEETPTLEDNQVEKSTPEKFDLGALYARDEGDEDASEGSLADADTDRLEEVQESDLPVQMGAIPVFKTVTPESPRTVLEQLRSTQRRFGIKLDSVKELEDQLGLPHTESSTSEDDDDGNQMFVDAPEYPFESMDQAMEEKKDFSVKQQSGDFDKSIEEVLSKIDNEAVDTHLEDHSQISPHETFQSPQEDDRVEGDCHNDSHDNSTRPKVFVHILSFADSGSDQVSGSNEVDQSATYEVQENPDLHEYTSQTRQESDTSFFSFTESTHSLDQGSSTSVHQEVRSNLPFEVIMNAQKDPRHSIPISVDEDGQEFEMASCLAPGQYNVSLTEVTSLENREHSTASLSSVRVQPSHESCASTAISRTFSGAEEDRGFQAKENIASDDEKIITNADASFDSGDGTVQTTVEMNSDGEKMTVETVAASGDKYQKTVASTEFQTMDVEDHESESDYEDAPDDEVTEKKYDSKVLNNFANEDNIDDKTGTSEQSDNNRPDDVEIVDKSFKSEVDGHNFGQEENPSSQSAEDVKSEKSDEFQEAEEDISLHDASSAGPEESSSRDNSHAELKLGGTDNKLLSADDGVALESDQPDETNSDTSEGDDQPLIFEPDEDEPGFVVFESSTVIEGVESVPPSYVEEPELKEVVTLDKASTSESAEQAAEDIISEVFAQLDEEVDSPSEVIEPDDVGGGIVEVYEEASEIYESDIIRPTSIQELESMRNTPEPVESTVLAEEVKSDRGKKRGLAFSVLPPAKKFKSIAKTLNPFLWLSRKPSLSSFATEVIPIPQLDEVNDDEAEVESDASSSSIELSVSRLEIGDDVGNEESRTSLNESASKPEDSAVEEIETKVDTESLSPKNGLETIEADKEMGAEDAEQREEIATETQNDISINGSDHDGQEGPIPIVGDTAEIEIEHESPLKEASNKTEINDNYETISEPEGVAEVVNHFTAAELIESQSTKNIAEEGAPDKSLETADKEDDAQHRNDVEERLEDEDKFDVTAEGNELIQDDAIRLQDSVPTIPRFRFIAPTLEDILQKDNGSRSTKNDYEDVNYVDKKDPEEALETEDPATKILKILEQKAKDKMEEKKQQDHGAKEKMNSTTENGSPSSLGNKSDHDKTEARESGDKRRVARKAKAMTKGEEEPPSRLTRAQQRKLEAEAEAGKLPKAVLTVAAQYIQKPENSNANAEVQDKIYNDPKPASKEQTDVSGSVMMDQREPESSVKRTRRRTVQSEKELSGGLEPQAQEGAKSEKKNVDYSQTSQVVASQTQAEAIDKKPKRKSRGRKKKVQDHENQVPDLSLKREELMSAAEEEKSIRESKRSPLNSQNEPEIPASDHFPTPARRSTRLRRQSQKEQASTQIDLKEDHVDQFIDEKAELDTRMKQESEGGQKDQIKDRPPPSAIPSLPSRRSTRLRRSKRHFDETEEKEQQAVPSSPVKNEPQQAQLAPGFEPTQQLSPKKRRGRQKKNAPAQSSPAADFSPPMPKLRVTSGNKWQLDLLDHPALRTRSKSPIKRSIQELSLDMEEELPKRRRRNIKKVADEIDPEEKRQEEEHRGRRRRRD